MARSYWNQIPTLKSIFKWFPKYHWTQYNLANLLSHKNRFIKGFMNNLIRVYVFKVWNCQKETLLSSAVKTVKTVSNWTNFFFFFLQMYLHEHTKVMSTPAIAQMLSCLLYYKRFFPYYVSNILAGLDNEGKGVVYSYDPIGNFHPCGFKASGSAGSLLQPVLDNQVCSLMKYDESLESLVQNF